MPKLPLPPSAEEIRRIPPETKLLPVGTVLARISFAGGAHPVQWNTFKNFGPGNGRFDHHLANAAGEARGQQRSIFYFAANALTCFAEVFQDTRRIDRFRNAPWLAVFELNQECRLLDLTGAYTTRVGASMAINTGNRRTARLWAREFYEAYQDLTGSTMRHLCTATSRPSLLTIEHGKSRLYRPSPNSIVRLPTSPCSTCSSIAPIRWDMACGEWMNESPAPILPEMNR